MKSRYVCKVKKICLYHLADKSGCIYEVKYHLADKSRYVCEVVLHLADKSRYVYFASQTSQDMSAR
jgi:hypothetical protein